MKNTITINANQNYTVECLDSVNDSTNSLYLRFITDGILVITFTGHGTLTFTPENNTRQIDPSWYLTSDLAFMADEVSFTILHPVSVNGEMMIQLVSGTAYQVTFKKRSGGGNVYGLDLTGNKLSLLEGAGSQEVELPTVEVDEKLSDKSKNPVQNKVVKAQFDDMDTRKQDALTAGENIILENNVISADPNIYIGNIPTNYSTEEKTIGTWTDGKPLYQKTILLNSIVFGSYQYIQLDSAVEAKRIEGVIYRTNNRVDNLDNYGVDDYYKHSISVRPSGIEYNISSIYADGWKSMMITIQYTKTSDSATTVPVGDASYYTTDERIVGRWIDGKPLYQKTLVLNSEKEIGNTWDWTSIGISAGDVDFYISAKAYNSAGTFWNVNATTISGYIAIQTERNMDTITVKYITIQYTKTTD